MYNIAIYYVYNSVSYTYGKKVLEVGLLNQWKRNIHIIYLCFITFSPCGLYNFLHFPPRIHYNNTCSHGFIKRDYGFCLHDLWKWFHSELKFVSLILWVRLIIVPMAKIWFQLVFFELLGQTFLLIFPVLHRMWFLNLNFGSAL